MELNRCHFASTVALAAASSAVHPEAAAAAKPKRALIKLGATVMDRSFFEGMGRRGESPRNTKGPEGPRPPRRPPAGEPRDPEQGFKSLGRWGIKNVVATAQIADGRLYATVEELNRLTEMAAKHGITVDILNPPFLPSSHIDRERHPAIMLGRVRSATAISSRSRR